MTKSTVILRFSGRSNALVRKNGVLVIVIHLEEDILDRSVASVLPICDDLFASVEFDSLLERPIEEFARQKSGLLLLALLPNGDLSLPALADQEYKLYLPAIIALKELEPDNPGANCPCGGFTADGRMVDLVQPQ